MGNQKSGYYYPNRLTLITLQVYEEVMGKNGLNAALNLAGLPHLINHYPPDNMEREVDFSEYSSLNWALEEMYGLHGAKVFALQAGKATFNDGLLRSGILAEAAAHKVNDPSWQCDVNSILSTLVKFFTQSSDQLCTLSATGNGYTYSVQRCPLCWGRKGADKSVCYLTAGLLQAALKWASNGCDIGVAESQCCAAGQDVCEFIISKIAPS